VRLARGELIMRWCCGCQCPDFAKFGITRCFAMYQPFFNAILLHLDKCDINIPA
jgi:hypothetical protein